ncbi:glycosyl hydrolases family 38 N-terminal domain-containing protein [Cokeromyces recurvatus]|uniref:glycosyl hydrolases family 38 N-terminal domain-containing protein n=1 Tax=Cokeromyces recurvatus TaxID=90255 RepID=UPI00221F6E42|nr:glycosyl hydrolases family 38 N-terminal domain-containing protein [Cokeromyces recurvatus]KAI7899040.1 glycosyl hydrolases family 38 N-terminal domain-containing protein [Cokeromyces recurvatus]
MDLLSQFQLGPQQSFNLQTFPTTTTPQVLNHPKLIKSIAIDRCSNFISAGANGNDINLLSQLYRARTNSNDYISIMVYSVPDLKRITFEEAIQQDFRPTHVGEWFGPSWSTHWFHVQIKIPKEFVGEEVQLIWNADNEAMIWSMEGVPLQGLTGGAGSDARHEYILTTNAEGGEIIQLYIEMACNGMFGAANGLIGPPDPDRFFNLTEVDLVVPNKLAWNLLYDFQIILGMARDFPEDSLRGTQALYTANNIVNAFIPDDDNSILKGLEIAHEFLKLRNGEAQHEIYAIGHCHIDTAWLWPFEETIRKAARSWSSQINLMDRYPDYKFVCSQAQQYQWIKERYNKLWERMIEKVALGQFLPTGGTWVEMDTIMPSGESLCRQFLLGQRFFEQNFGKRCKVFWLPDSFGYSPQLPQLVKLADMDYFFTQKLSWNNVNKFPLTTFWWIGLDGSKVLTHMAPSETYNAQCTPEELVRSLMNHRDKMYSNTSLLVYGNGDGGGGPVAGMIERLRRMRNIDGLPKTEMALTTHFYQQIEMTSKELPYWKGELYFELHRGIYTTQAFCKKLNRSCEFLLRDIEMLATFAMLLYPDQFQYPQVEFTEFWKLLNLTQFHDVISGSAIEMVYEDCLQMFTKIDVLGKQIRYDLLTLLLHETRKESDKLHVSTMPVNSYAKSLAVINTLAWEREAVVLEVPLKEFDDTSIVKQFSAFGQSGYVLVTHIPAISAIGVPLSVPTSINDSERTKVQTDSQSNIMMENALIRATFDQSGHLIHLYDKQLERELIKAGERGNVFRLYEDVPLFWDAWDVEIYHLEKYKTIEEGSVQILEQGPLRASILIEKEISKTSRLRQIVVLNIHSQRLDFETEVDWNENRQFLKVEFAWDIMTDHVNYECQYGYVQRPTHYNTSWESAKFEVVAHKYADMSEYGYGVALLSDCKYGFSAYQNCMRLSLLRSPKAPDSNCDVGHHSFKYAIYPHPNHFLQSNVVQEGYNFNSPLITRVIAEDKTFDLKSALPQFRIENAPNVVLDTIKKAEDSNHVIMRIYEAYGGHAQARLIRYIEWK